MLENILFVVEWPALAGHFVLYGFIPAILAVVGVVALDMRRTARAAARVKNEPTRFLAPYRDEHGMPIYFEAGEDPSARSARRVFRETRRARIEKNSGR
jgi:hypothetical protein